MPKPDKQNKTTAQQAMFQTPALDLSCPSCGDQVPRHFQHAKIAVCESCNSVIYLDGAEATIAGEQSAVADYPSLFQLHQRYTYQDLVFEPVGMLRYDYGRGYWDEWWCLTDANEGRWISVDEGDFVIEKPINVPTDAPSKKELINGRHLTVLNLPWTVTEIGEATFVGMRGELPDAINQQRTFWYCHLSRPGSELLTLEYDNPYNPPSDAFLGKWMDPFLIKAL